MTDVTSTADTLVSQVTPLLGITPHESTQLQSMNTPEDVKEILGTRAFQRYVDTPIQTLDGIVVNQPKRFLLLAKEAKKIVEEIRIKKINEQWAGIPREQLLNQSFNDQLNSIQILEQLAPLQLAKEHLPGNIIDILERLCKADHIIFKCIRINWLSIIITGISGTIITMPDIAYVSIFMDNDLTHITEDHFKIKLIARLLDQIYVIQPPMLPLRYDDAPPGEYEYSQPHTSTDGVRPSAPQFPEHLHSLLTHS